MTQRYMNHQTLVPACLTVHISWKPGENYNNWQAAHRDEDFHFQEIQFSETLARSFGDLCFFQKAQLIQVALLVCMFLESSAC